MKRIIFHIGTHKTGTTSIQKVLSSNRDKLKANDVFYPYSGAIYGDSAKHYGGSVNHNIFKKALIDKDTSKNIFDYYLDEFELSNCKNMLISIEALSNPIHTKRAIKLLKTYSPKYKFSVVCVLRRQDYFIESLYVENVKSRIKSGKCFNDYLNNLNPDRYNYYHILCLWGRLTSNIIIQKFDDLVKDGDLTDALLTSVNLKPLKMTTGHQNSSPDRRLVQVMVEMNNRGLSYNAPLLYELHNSSYPLETRLKQFFTTNKRQQFLEQCSVQNKQLANKFEIQFDSKVPQLNESNVNNSVDVDYIISLKEQILRWPYRNNSKKSKYITDFSENSTTRLISKLALMSEQRLMPRFVNNSEYKYEITNKFYANLSISNINLCKRDVDILEGYFPNCLTTEIALAEYFHLIKNWEKEQKQWHKCINNFQSKQTDNWQHREIMCEILREDYSSALSKIDNLIKFNPNNYKYQITKAKIFIKSGNYKNATKFLIKLIRTYPTRQVAYQQHLHLISIIGQPKDLKKFAKIYSIIFPNNMNIALHNANALIHLGKVTRAEKIFKKIIKVDPCFLKAYVRYANLANMHLDGDRQRKVLKIIQAKLSKLSVRVELSMSDYENIDILSLYRLRAKISLSISDRKSLKYCIKKLSFLNPKDEFVHGVEKFLEKTKTNKETNKLDKKIFVIGLSKTGTTSISNALEILGYHTMHFTNKYTGQLLCSDDAYLFDVLSDTPVCDIFEELYKLFPNAKFIYTVRDKYQWEKSIKNHFYKNLYVSDVRSLTSINRSKYWIKIHTNLYAKFNSWIEAYEAYHSRVLNFFNDKPEDKLLVLDMNDDDKWEQICQFLSMEIPAVNFPWDNKTLQIHTY